MACSDVHTMVACVPSVSVLVSHLLLHLRVCEHLNGGPPGLRIGQLPHRELDRRQGSLTKRENNVVVNPNLSSFSFTERGNAIKPFYISLDH